MTNLDTQRHDYSEERQRTKTSDFPLLTSSLKNKQMKKATILVNVGSPSSLKLRDIRKFLSEFLNDHRVIDLPLIVRLVLVNLIIIPFRASKSRDMYKQIWNENNSPIINHGYDLVDKLSKKTDENHHIYLAMRYGKPNLKKVINDIYNKQYNEIKIVPLFPHYASSTVGSIIEKTMQIVSKWNSIPTINFSAPFYDNPAFINAWECNLNRYNIDDYEHVLFSYHGLPLSHLNRSHIGNDNCENRNCNLGVNADNKFCYQAQCYETTKLLADKLKIPLDKYSVCFQSRLSKQWLEPFADKTIIKLAERGIKKILVLPLSFVADCLETSYEIGMEYDELFRKHGGEKLTLADSLNANDFWIDALKKIIID